MDVKILSASTLKLTAILCMIIDHVGVVFFPEQYIYRIIGRLAFPIFAFLIAEGMTYTKSTNKYLQRLFIFGVISEIPFDLAFSQTIIDLSTWNIMFTLLIGAVGIMLIIRWGYLPVTATVIFILMLIAQLVNTDGGAMGVATIVMFYILRGNMNQVFGMLLIIYGVILGWVYRYAIFAIIPIYCYNGKKGHNIKWIGYWIYPVHLLILVIIRDYIR